MLFIMSAFKAYDIRGVYNLDFNKDDVYKIGFCLPSLLSAETILVGRDVRISSEEIYSSLVAGITDAGANVTSAGLTTTPMVYFATAKHKFKASVQITASHNPKEYNGLKISRANAVPVGYDTGLSELEQMIKSVSPEPSSSKGSINTLEMQDEYITFMKHYLSDISDLKIGVDCSNGMASIIIRKIIGDTPMYIYDTLDGTFPNHEPNPLIEKNVKDLKQLVTDHKLDIGVIFDGDADRVMFVDELGQFIRPDLIIAVMGLYFLSDNIENVLYDIRTSRSVTDYIERLGGIPNMWKVGHSHAKVKMREINAAYGGELAGHYYFRDFFFCDSGILASLIILDIVAQMKKEGLSFSTLIASINCHSNTGEINFKIEDKDGAMNALRDKYAKHEKPLAFFDFDGYRIEYTKWWFNVRPSNTEPYLRLVIEADNENLLREKRSEIERVLKDFQV